MNYGAMLMGGKVGWFSERILLFIGVVINTCITRKEGSEYATEDKVWDELGNYKYVVTSYYGSGGHAGKYIAEILYKGDDEVKAKKIWFSRIGERAISNIMYSRDYGAFRANLRVSADVEGTSLGHLDGGYTSSILYPIHMFETNNDFGDLVLTKDIRLLDDKLWYVVRVCDISLEDCCLVGQVMLKTESKDEVVGYWDDNLESGKDENGYSKYHYYIFQSNIWLTNIL